ncbi:stage V sporulation protein AA [Terribacillus saccharophilus]|uniref:stage V sporulation protein AA n=1 Tax=Terribacillus saccharophilus TaxID=361277 RepID=UPI000BA55AF2|nr:stage V sporulation protein AA [Terribacillus saccharophilus]PAF19413.1 stage V sporulation protein AA [Terribacillus saccharophilus]PAF22532.1 stage V sporulation protein AA [Terribacillus saccharophilus]PAF38721.1 stage V sporulation protein AA [Terribacillus saccharophilus]PAF40747.1 stage V sporulation protein AA [Terribacillus saccharophilus]
MPAIVYIRFIRKITTSPESVIKLKDIAHIANAGDYKERMLDTVIYRITKKDSNIVVLDCFSVFQQLMKLFPEHELQLIGAEQTIVHVQHARKRTVWPLVILIWLLLFIGSAMTIMNFHFDVAMEPVQQQIHFLLTGERLVHPLWLQIPYSIGIGVGMILFFNHVFKKRLNEEPSPLEVEMHKYQRDMDVYVAYHENELEQQHVDRHS